MIFYIHPDSEFTYCLCLLSGVEIQCQQCQCQLAVFLLHNEGRLLGRTRGTRSRPRPRRWRPSSTPSCRPRSSRRTASCGASRSAVYIYPMSTQYLHNICTISTPYLYMVWRLQVCCTDSFRKDVEGLKQQLDSLLCSRQARDTGICQVSVDDFDIE